METYQSHTARTDTTLGRSQNVACGVTSKVPVGDVSVVHRKRRLRYRPLRSRPAARATLSWHRGSGSSLLNSRFCRWTTIRVWRRSFSLRLLAAALARRSEKRNSGLVVRPKFKFQVHNLVLITNMRNAFRHLLTNLTDGYCVCLECVCVGRPPLKDRLQKDKLRLVR